MRHGNYSSLADIEPEPITELDYYSYEDVKEARGSGMKTGILIGLITGAAFVATLSVVILHKAVPSAKAG